MAIYNNPTYEPQAWHYFLIYQAANAIVLFYNIFAIRRTSWVHDLGCKFPRWSRVNHTNQTTVVVSLTSFLVILITCLSRTPQMQTTEFVWTALINESGWSSNGIAFLTGLINPNYVYAGIDGAIHLAEECSNASMAVPFALMSTLSIGFITSFAFVIAMG